jgi:hypothetical protein
MACRTRGDKLCAQDFFFVKPETKRMLGRLRNIWENNIKKDRLKRGWWLWTGFIWGRGQALLNTVRTFGFHKRRGIFVSWKACKL